ncbi:MAG: hypothetical protein HY370_04595 [Proteobacteria bacterium]|nr:hypothetical protein [Pseudomonadota bacterium]
MKHYFLILFLIWLTMLFVMGTLWIMISIGMHFGIYTAIIPVSLVAGFYYWLFRGDWFQSNIREPMAATFDRGTGMDLFMHFQIFSLICGLLGIGGMILGAGYMYPVAASDVMETMYATEKYWAVFKSRASLATTGGFAFGALVYLYLLADSRNIKWLQLAIIGVGCLFFFLIGYLM